MLLKEIFESEGVFDDAFNFAVENCDRNQRSVFLTQVDEYLHLKPDFAKSIQGIRNARGFAETELAIDQLRDGCQKLGLNHSRHEISILLNRVAYVGSSDEADCWRRLFNKIWRKREKQLFKYR